MTDLFGTAPRAPQAPGSYSGARYTRLAIVVAVMFACFTVTALLPRQAAARVERWLVVVAVAGVLLGLFTFFRTAWQFRGDDKVPLVLAGLLGALATWRLGNVLNGHDPDLYLGRGFRVHIGGTPWRWLGYSSAETGILTVLSVGLALAGLWLVGSLQHYVKRTNKAAAMVVAAASVALLWCVWLIVN